MAIVAEGIIEEEEVEAIREWFGETAKPKGTANGQVITEREMHRIAVKLTVDTFGAKIYHHLR